MIPLTSLPFNLILLHFLRVDKDHDGHINQAELEEWILLKVQEHFDEANDETERIFKHLDSDTDGQFHSLNLYRFCTNVC